MNILAFLLLYLSRVLYIPVCFRDIDIYVVEIQPYKSLCV